MGNGARCGEKSKKIPVSRLDYSSMPSDGGFGYSDNEDGDIEKKNLNVKINQTW